MSATWIPLGSQPVPPLVEGQWLKVQGGAMVWSALAPFAPGSELAYAEIAGSNVTVPVVAEASATTLVTAPATTFDGTPVVIEFFAYQCNAGGGTNGQVIFSLWDGSTNLGVVAAAGSATVTLYNHINIRRRLTPSAGSHTYSIRAYAIVTAGILVVGAGGPGGVGTPPPAFIRITKA